MCGRYALYKTLAEMASLFDAKVGDDGLWDWEPNYNIAPASVVPVMAWDGRRQRKIVPMRWGLHPHWKKTPPEGRPLFNARLETAHEKASFRTPFRRRRALIPTNGWYEWDRFEGDKVPHFIYDSEHESFAFAALWDQWRVDEGITLLTATILTEPATGDIKHIHHRMPVRLPQKYWNNWLSWDSNPQKTLDHRLDGHSLDHHEVSNVVNSGRAKGEDLMRPV